MLRTLFKSEALFENADLRADLAAPAPQLPVATPRIVRRFFLGFLCNSSPALRPVGFFLLYLLQQQPFKFLSLITLFSSLPPVLLFSRGTMARW